MGVGESIFHQLNGQHEAQRQYQFDFMPTARTEGPYALTLETGDTTVHVVADDFGKHGLMLDSLRIVGEGSRPSGNSDGLVHLVERIVTEVECPYGPIKCIENDERLTCAVLRTDPTGDGCFFEIVVSGGNELDLKHYTVLPRGNERSRTPVNMGRTVFEKMTDGLVEALAVSH
jgi:hypothetical protein